MEIGHVNCRLEHRSLISLYLPADVIEPFTGKERIAAMIRYLDQYSSSVGDETAFEIDIVAFSRGSAQARDFVNHIVGNYQNGYYRYQDKQGQEHCQKVNFRFMGLFDTVLSEHTSSYQLSIPDAFEFVAKAVAAKARQTVVGI